jgi:ornithine carbamoyltransferase
MPQHFLSFENYSGAEIDELLSLAELLKRKRLPGFQPLEGKTAALIFEKQSLRTLVSFQVGIAQFGGQGVFLSQLQIGLGSREPSRDVAEVLSRYNDLIIARTMKHSTVQELAQFSTIPVINALTDLSHPCQILADAFTLKEHGLLTKQAKIVFVGDGNNCVNSWLELASKIPLHFVLACPKGYEPDAEILSRACASGISEIEITNDLLDAVNEADVLYTDVWVSMGQEQEKEQRFKAFEAFQINQKLLDLAAPDCVVMHCLPAHRGEEITAEVLEGPQSVVIQEAENRLHVQKAVMAYLVDSSFRAVKPTNGKVAHEPRQHELV